MKRSVSIISSSETVRTSSANCCVIGNVSLPGICTRKPSAIVGGGGIETRSPLRNDCKVSSAVGGPTGEQRIFELCALAAVATPANKPPPLHGASTQSSSGTSSNNSKPHVPWPASTK